MSEQLLWDAFRASRSIEARNALVEHYHGMLLRYAVQLVRKLPAGVGVEAEDLAQDAVPALMDLITTFDPERQVRFTTYAARRIVGAMRDSLRAMDFVPRLERKRQKENPNHPIRQVLQLITSRHHNGDDGDVLRQKNSEPTASPELPRLELQEFWKRAYRGLRRTERLVVLMYYRDQMTMRQVGLTLELSEARVSQMLSSILRRIREQADASDLLDQLPLSD